MSLSLSGFAWPLSQLDEAIELLARHIGGHGRTPRGVTSLSDADVDDVEAFGRAIERLLVAHSLEVEPSALRFGGLDRIPAPLILRLPGEEEPNFVVIAGQRGRSLLALTTDRRWRRLDARECAEALRSSTGIDERRAIESLLEAAGVTPSRRTFVSRALLTEQLADKKVADAWQVIAEPGGEFGWLLRRAGVVREAAALVALHAAQFGLWLVSWTLVGRGALEGRTDWGWLTAWVLLLATIVPLQVWTTWVQGALALGVGRLLKERLLVGATRLDSEQVRHQGAGELLARVLESDAVESLAIGGGLQAGLAIVELLMSGGVLWLGAAGGAHLTVLAALVGGTGVAALAYHRQRTAWSIARLDLTNQLVEHVAGHRTRLAQEHPKRWHADEDRSLEDYTSRSSALDRWVPTLLVTVPRGWLAIGFGILAPSFVSGASATSLAISLGGVLLAGLALRRFAEGLSQLSGAAIGWREARPLFHAAAARPLRPAIADHAGSETDAAGDLEVRDLSFRYPTGTAPVLTGCSLNARAGERLLLEGRSGGGKSTFASLVAGLRAPTAGLVLVNGLDRRTLGAHAWRQRVVAAPQFHENHVFCETFAFNLLMGRRWPPTDADLEEAEVIARELGLGDLLDRMPAGLMQLVGEGGWQLSHGERGRLFMARALLQRGEVMILDETFAALDPETLQQTLECVLRRAPTLMVIAHP
jgi:ATP-binding cassette subfamily B protein